MRLYDQSMELASDKYEKTVEELEDENNELKAKIKELKELKEMIKNLENQLIEAQKKS